MQKNIVSENAHNFGTASPTDVPRICKEQGLFNSEKSDTSNYPTLGSDFLFDFSSSDFTALDGTGRDGSYPIDCYELRLLEHMQC